MGLGIERIASYFPSRTLTAGELANRFGLDIAFVRYRLGVDRIFVAAETEHVSDMATAAVRRLCDTSPGLADRIQALVVCTQTPDYQLPHVSAMVQDKAGLCTDVAAFDISLGCSGFVYGLSVLESFMEHNRLDCGVLVTAETYSKVIDDADGNTKSLFSDAAAATLVSRKGMLRSGRYTFGTSGDQYESLIVRPALGHDETGLRRLSMDGRSIFAFVLDSVPADVSRCLGANGVTMADLDLLVFHQASGFLLDMLSKKLGLTAGDPRLARTLNIHGNTVSSSIPLALKEYLERGHYGRILISGFGVGLSWASTVLNAEDTHA